MTHFAKITFTLGIAISLTTTAYAQELGDKAFSRTDIKASHLPVKRDAFISLFGSERIFIVTPQSEILIEKEVLQKEIPSKWINTIDYLEPEHANRYFEISKKGAFLLTLKEEFFDEAIERVQNL